MGRGDYVEVDGAVLEDFPDGAYLIGIGAGRTLTGYVPGRLKAQGFSVEVGDLVSLEVSPYDLTRGRIIAKK